MPITPTGAERIAHAIHALRPDWPLTSLRTFIDQPALTNRPPRDVAIALTWVALDPNTRTPARALENGPWWKAALTDETTTERPRQTTCPIHNELEPCGPCKRDRTPAPNAHPLQLARAELATIRANNCPHGITPGHGKCNDCQRNKTQTPKPAKPHKNPTTQDTP